MFVFDLNGLLCPGDLFHSTIEGITVRASDGVLYPVSAWPVIDLALSAVRAKAGQQAIAAALKSWGTQVR